MFAMLTSLIDRVVRPVRTIFSWIARVTPGMKSLPSVSSEMRWSLITFFFLLILYVASLISYLLSQRTNIGLLEWILYFALGVIGLPIVVFWLVRFLSIKEESRYPEIDRVWDVALDELDAQEISLLQVPIFLVLGTKDHLQAESLIQASRLSVPVSQNSPGADISVYGNHEGVFVFLSGCSSLSGLSGERKQASAFAPPSSAAPASSSAGGTITFDEVSAPQGAQGAASGTLANFAAQPAPPEAGQTLNTAAGPAAPQGAASAGALGGTIMLPDGMTFTSSSPASRVSSLHSEELAVYEDKLRHVCGLLKKSRGAFCPINGLLTVLPLELVETAPGPTQEALQSDLSTLRSELKVRCANHLLVTGFEDDAGFLEFVKRVGAEMAAENRFGKGCDNIWSLPVSERLSSVGSHAVGAVEDWVYMLFQKDNSLKHRYNSRLYMLLCRTRGKFLENLRRVLAGGFGFDASVDPELVDTQFLFGGCYFGAVGSRADKQAFIKGVFQRVAEREGQLEWTPEALEQDQGYRFSANLFALLGFLSILSIAGVMLYYFLVLKQEPA